MLFHYINSDDDNANTTVANNANDNADDDNTNNDANDNNNNITTIAEPDVVSWGMGSVPGPLLQLYEWGLHLDASSGKYWPACRKLN